LRKQRVVIQFRMYVEICQIDVPDSLSDAHAMHVRPNMMVRIRIVID